MEPRRQPLAALNDALLDAFRTRNDLARLVGLGLGEQLDNIAGGDNDAAVVFNLIEWAESRGRTLELAGAALAANPANAKLREAVAALGLPLPPLTPAQRLGSPALRPWLLGSGAGLLVALLVVGWLAYSQATSGLRIDAIRYYPTESTLDVQGAELGRDRRGDQPPDPYAVLDRAPFRTAVHCGTRRPDHATDTRYGDGDPRPAH